MRDDLCVNYKLVCISYFVSTFVCMYIARAFRPICDIIGHL
jgi:hypothetical protein